jgi:hypothetical protein
MPVVAVDIEQEVAILDDDSCVLAFAVPAVSGD